MAVERAFPAAPVQVGRGLVASSFQYYLTGAEYLRVQWTSRAPAIVGLAITTHVRLWSDTDRAIQLLEHSARVAGATSVVYPLSAGAILNLRLSLNAAGVKYGEIFVRAQLLVGEGAAATVIGTLLQGFLSSGNELGWPGSPIQHTHDSRGTLESFFWIFNAVPLRLENEVPSGVRWRIICGVGEVQTSAVAGNRNIVLQVFDPSGTTAKWYGPAGVLQPASTTYYYSFGAGMPPNTVLADVFVVLPWPIGLELGAGDIIRMAVGNAQAGDAIFGHGGQYREWIEL